MESKYAKPIVIFVVMSLILATLFFTLPINLFNGKIVVENGLQELVIDRPLSLSYFIGLGYDEADMVGVKDFYLTGTGKMMAFIFILGFPAILAYRFYLKSTSNKDK